MSRPQGNTEAGEAPASKQRLKVTSERVVLLVLSVLLAAAVIVIYRLSFAYMQTKQSFQTLRDEHEAVKRNLTEILSEIKPYNMVDPFQGNINESCLKCEEGWERRGGKCYYFSTSSSPWNESRDECRHQGGDLVKIDSREEQTHLELNLRGKMNHPEDKFWIGLTDSKEEGAWLWSDGSPLNTSLSFWSGVEPDNWAEEDPDGEHCVRMGEKAGAHDLKCWFDKSCKVPHRRICEKPEEIGRASLKCSSV